MQRSIALDVFRGLTVALMILVNNPGSWSHVYAPLLHAPWHGFTPTDLVFPFFLFAVGNASAIVLPRLWEENRSLFFQKVLKRTLLIFLIGLCLNWVPFFVWVGDELKFKSWTWINAEGIEVGLRIFGVLQRIALSYGLAAVLCYFFPKRVLATSLVLLLIYWGLCLIFGHGPDIYSIEGWFGTHVDRFLFGPVHLYQGDGAPFDPEGLTSALPSVAQVMLGFWAGNKLIKTEKRLVLREFALYGLAMVGVGLLWSLVHPINKKIWTGSYVLVTTGLALWLLAILVGQLDIKGKRGWWVTVMEAFGKNPLFIYVMSGLIPKTLALTRIPHLDGKYLTPFQWFYEHVCAHFPGSPNNGSLLYAIILVSAYGALALWLDKKKIYFKV